MTARPRRGAALPNSGAGKANTLRERAQARGRIYGAAARYDDLRRDSAYRAKFASECGLLVPENELKWDALRPSQARFNFDAADWMARFAREHGMAFRGHTLVWHRALPPWFNRSVKRGNARDILVEHITRVCQHYAGIASSWDVVNEAIDGSSDGVDGLRASPWLKLLGPEYIDLAFRTAHSADPAAMLVYNDFGLELDAAWCDTRRQRVLRLVGDLLNLGTPIHAIGIQSHLEPHLAPFNTVKFKAFVDEIAALGIKVIVSELDVTDRHLPASISERDTAVAKLYRDYAAAVLAQRTVTSLITWGLSDRYSWLNHEDGSRREDGLPVRGLPLDASLERKPAYRALSTALSD